jgi:hypothetical protein
MLFSVKLLRGHLLPMTCLERDCLVANHGYSLATRAARALKFKRSPRGSAAAFVPSKPLSPTADAARAQPAADDMSHAAVSAQYTIAAGTAGSPSSRNISCATSVHCRYPVQATGWCQQCDANRLSKMDCPPCSCMYISSLL